MSSFDRDSQLASLLPQLEAYRVAMDSEPVLQSTPPPIATIAGNFDLRSSSEIDQPMERVSLEIAEEVADDTKQLEESNIVAYPTLFSTQFSSSAAVEDEGENEDPLQQRSSKVVTQDNFPILKIADDRKHASLLRQDGSRHSTSNETDFGTIPKFPGLLTIHTPIDGILNRFNKFKSFVLGIGTIGTADELLVRSLVANTVSRCRNKTDRKTILVTVRPPNGHLVVNESTEFTRVLWTYYGETKADTKAWHSQLSSLPGWKREFGLIVIDLGNVRFPSMPRIGKLCDGVVLQMFEPSNSRDTILAMKSLQKDRLKLLGAWSVEQSLNKLSA